MTVGLCAINKKKHRSLTTQNPTDFSKASELL